MINPNNCSTCSHKQVNDDPELHCYMFKHEPDDVRMQHSGRRLDIFELLRVIKDAQDLGVLRVRTIRAKEAGE